MSNEIERLARLEQGQADLKEDVTEIRETVVALRDNHLEHLKGQISSLDTKISYYIGGGTVVIGTIELLAKIFLK